MEIYLAGATPYAKILFSDDKVLEITKEIKPNFLESFYYANKSTKLLIDNSKNFLLDSGAFTLRQNTTENIDWLEYIKKYANYINENNIDLFFELDIDNLIGYEKVIEYRNILEELTNKKAIPVWHPQRGFEEFTDMCKNYDYVSIGGVVGQGKSISNKYHTIFPNLITEAHKYNCKIHGLGCTGLDMVTKCKFDSVDSTSWLSGIRFGNLYVFNGNTLLKYKKPKNSRLTENYKEISKMQYIEWLKFVKYAREFL